MVKELVCALSLASCTFVAYAGLTISASAPLPTMSSFPQADPVRDWDIRDANTTVFRDYDEKIVSTQVRGHRAMKRNPEIKRRTISSRFQPFQNLRQQENLRLPSAYEIESVYYEWEEYNAKPGIRENTFLCYNDPFSVKFRSCKILTERRGTTQAFQGLSALGQLSIEHQIVANRHADLPEYSHKSDKVVITYRPHASPLPPAKHRQLVYSAFRSGVIRGAEDLLAIYSEQSHQHVPILSPNEQAKIKFRALRPEDTLVEKTHFQQNYQLSHTHEMLPYNFRIYKVTYAWQPYLNSPNAQEVVKLCYTPPGQRAPAECHVLKERTGTTTVFEDRDASGRLTIIHQLSGKAVGYPLESTKSDHLSIEYYPPRVLARLGK